MKINFLNIQRFAFASIASATMVSCVGNLIFEEDLCPPEPPVIEYPAKVLVSLKYDYNIQRADMRKDHVGWARVVALDENNVIVDERIVANSDTLAPLKENDFAVDFTGLAPGTYRFMATAFQRDYDFLSAADSARFRVAYPKKNEKINTYKSLLDRLSVENADGSHYVNAPASGLDTLWIGQSVVSGGLVVPSPSLGVENVVRDTVSLVRDTKYIHITLHQIAERDQIFDDMFDVKILGANGSLAWDNAVQEDEILEYRPHAAWTTAMSEQGNVFDTQEEAELSPEDDPIVERAAHFDLSCSRLMYDGLGSNTILCISRKEDDKEVVRINLPYYLSFGRDAYSTRNYSRQEYLDREYDYHLDFFLLNSEWVYMNLSVNILPWVRRFQRVSL